MTVVDTPPRGKSIASLLGNVPTERGAASRLSESPLWDRQREFYRQDTEPIWGTGTTTGPTRGPAGPACRR